MDSGQEAWLLLRAMVALLAVVALAFVSLRFGLPWLMRHRGDPRSRSLEVMEYYPLDRNHRLYVVRWNDERLLLATSPERVDLVARAGSSFEDAVARAKAAEPGGER